MSVPDNEQITETLLFAEGYNQARVLARKLVTIFGLAREMLSAQVHYDWGLRALKTVLRGCGDAIEGRRRLQMEERQQQKQQQQQRIGVPDAEQLQLVVQNVQLNTLSKLTFADAQRFRVLLDDIFPGVARQSVTDKSNRNGISSRTKPTRWNSLTCAKMWRRRHSSWECT